jgi:uncharacterized protein (TIGR02594 family)
MSKENLEKNYSWLKTAPTTKMIEEALKYYGIKEAYGKADNPTLMAWASSLGQDVKEVFVADSVAWCGLFIGIVAKNSGKEVVKSPLWALNWGNFGNYAQIPMFGDVLVFTRITEEGKKAGHEGLYIGEDDDCYHVLGGNQSDKVCIARKLKSRLYVARRPNYNNQPICVKKVKLPTNGNISTNES